MYSGSIPALNAEMIASLRTFLRIPSVSSDPAYKEAVNTCAKWLSAYLMKIGLVKTFLHQTALHPVVYSEFIIDPSYPTVLFYGHYDVQPAGSSREWTYTPFDAAIHNGYLHGRGTADDKGPIFIQLAAIDHLVRHRDQFRVNIRCIFEGEEEIGSPHLSSFIKMNKQKINADVVVICDTKMFSRNKPAITYSLRGALNAELSVINSSKDLHSGTYGGMIDNPAEILSSLINGLQDKNGYIKIGGFYRNIIIVTEEERRFMRTQGPDDVQLTTSAEISSGKHEPGYSLYEQTTIRPSIAVSAIKAGHTGAGIKNIIPSSAKATFSMRLVRGQSPEEIAKLFAAHIKRSVPSHLKYNIKFSSMVAPVETQRRHPYMTAAARAYAMAFPDRPVYLRSGGTIPVVSLLAGHITAPVILMGFAVAGDNMHAANEKFSLRVLQRGIHTMILFLKNISAFSVLKKYHHDN